MMSLPWPLCFCRTAVGAAVLKELLCMSWGSKSSPNRRGRRISRFRFGTHAPILSKRRRDPQMTFRSRTIGKYEPLFLLQKHREVLNARIQAKFCDFRPIRPNFAC
ncbi:hypothetical protein L596_001605 [Steinernema carpocapsae]|uniref:Secreted protein n=1 Tax=Steinernema carpocapsae TaxID=34508 RepID=A0A4U8UMQ3_STECR|nr:hypothetical protein L596_001605 [Steinernema carpocapsae]